MLRESLAAYGLGEDRILPIDSNCNYRFENLFAIESVWTENLIHPGVTELMRDGIPISTRKDLPTRLAVSRISSFSRTLSTIVSRSKLCWLLGFYACCRGRLAVSRTG